MIAARVDAVAAVPVHSRRFVRAVRLRMERTGADGVVLRAGEIAPTVHDVLQGIFVRIAEGRGLRPSGAMVAYRAEDFRDGVLVVATLPMELP